MFFKIFGVAKSEAFGSLTEPNIHYLLVCASKDPECNRVVRVLAVILSG